LSWMSTVSDCPMWLSALEAHASKRSSGIAIAEVGPAGAISRSVTHAEFFAAVRARAHDVSESLAPGETMLAALPSGIALATWFAGALAAGVRLVLMHPSSGDGEFASVSARANVKAAVKLDGELRLASSSVSKDAGRRGTSEHSHGAIVLGSSGSTGLPKLAIRSAAALDADASAVSDGLTLTPDDVILFVPPLCHSYGVDVLVGAMLSGAALRVMTAFEPAGVTVQLARGVTVLPGVPFLYESLAWLARTPPGSAAAGSAAAGSALAGSVPTTAAAHSLRVALSAGSPLAPRVRDGFQNRWNIRIGQLYGATELGTVAINLPGSGLGEGSIGVPLPGVSFRIVDPENSARELPPGREGELAVRAPSMLSGYVDADCPLADGHFLTGDLARIDPSGNATLTGRLRLLIDTGGFKVNPLEVESALAEHPGVAECVVVPFALSDTVQRPHALFVATDPDRPPTASELRAFLRRSLAPVKIPRSFQVVASLPKTPTGKPARNQLSSGSRSCTDPRGE